MSYLKLFVILAIPAGIIGFLVGYFREKWLAKKQIESIKMILDQKRKEPK
jgi:hypothetical protein